MCRIIFISHIKTHFVPSPFSFFTVHERPFPTNFTDERIATIRFKKSRSVPEWILINIIFQDRVVVTPTNRRNLGESFTRDGDEKGGNMGGIKHRRETMPPCATAIRFEKQFLQPRMVILSRTTEYVPKLSFTVKLLSSDSFLTVGRSFCQHIGETRFVHSIQNGFTFLYSYCGRNCT